jgi:hypothetical protein
LSVPRVHSTEVARTVLSRYPVEDILLEEPELRNVVAHIQGSL